MKGRILCILLLSAWLLQSLFPVLYYQWERMECWQSFAQLKNTIPVQDLHTLTFNSEDDIHWEKKDKEFVLQGKLYDVVNIRKEAGAIVITCARDHKEQQLIEAYHQSLKKDKGSKLKPSTRKINLYTPHLARFTFCRSFSIKYIGTKVIKLPGSFNKIILPPPESSFC